jgi:hypothetical protein
MTEVDYLPAKAHYDTLLRLLHERAFHHGRPSATTGALVQLLQGRPVEGQKAKQHLHAEGVMIMRRADILRLFSHLYGGEDDAGGSVRWGYSTSDRMVHLVRAVGRTAHFSNGRFDHIQEGFGMLCAEAGVELADFANAWRLIYWNHRTQFPHPARVSSTLPTNASTVCLTRVHAAMCTPSQW